MLSLQIIALRWGRVSHLRVYGTPVKTATGKDACLADKCSFLQSDAGTHVSYWHKSDTIKSGFALQHWVAERSGRLHAISPFLASQVVS